MDMYSRAVIWIVPSKWAEPFGRVSIEAQAAGRRVLVSDRGGLPETVPTPDYIVPGFDKTVWADRISDALQTTRRERKGFSLAIPPIKMRAIGNPLSPTSSEHKEINMLCSLLFA